MNKLTNHGPEIESILQHAIDKNQSAAPDIRDGIDFLVIIIFIILVCMLTGYVIGRH